MVQEGGKRKILFKKMPNGNIRGYIDTPDKRGASELQFINSENDSMQTITTAHIPKIIQKQQLEVKDDCTTNAITTVQKDNLIIEEERIRKLTERECFRLMGVDDSDIDKIQSAGISMTQQYKMAGNSIVVDVLYHIFRKLIVETKADYGTQLELF